MSLEELPGANNALTMSVIGLVLSLSCGPVGIVFSIIALNAAKKANRLHLANPEMYTGYKNVKTAKILAYIGLAIAIVFLALIIFYFTVLIANMGMSRIQ